MSRKYVLCPGTDDSATYLRPRPNGDYLEWLRDNDASYTSSKPLNSYRSKKIRKKCCHEKKHSVVTRRNI